jgi:hypothetical protein
MKPDLRAYFEIVFSPQLHCGAAVQLPLKPEFPNRL